MQSYFQIQSTEVEEIFEEPTRHNFRKSRRAQILEKIC